MEYNSAVRKNENLLFAATWMDLEGIVLSEVSQTKTNTVWYHLYVESKEYNKLVNITRKKQTQRHREKASGYQRGEGRWEGPYRGRRLRVTNYYV